MMQSEIEISEIRNRILKTRYPFSLDKVEVRASPIHGRGVFAKQNIPQGELVTLYPDDFMFNCPERFKREIQWSKVTPG